VTSYWSAAQTELTSSENRNTSLSPDCICRLNAQAELNSRLATK
jgi:hypothetical protein